MNPDRYGRVISGRGGPAGTLEDLMTLNRDLLPDGSQSWIDRAVRAIAGPDRDPSVGLRRDPDYIVPPDERKAAMRGLDQLEVKWSVFGIVLSAVIAIGVAVYVASVNETTKNGKATVTVTPDAFLVGGLVLLFCVVGLVALRFRKRTMVAFAFMLNGLALTLVLLPLGLALVLLGGWLMLRAFRINRYGTANSKAVARQASSRPRGGSGPKAAPKAAGSSKSSGKATPGSRTPTANKRYTPKSPPRRKIPKPTE
jgi:hypothetical protein